MSYSRYSKPRNCCCRCVPSPCRRKRYLRNRRRWKPSYRRPIYNRTYINYRLPQTSLGRTKDGRGTRFQEFLTNRVYDAAELAADYVTTRAASSLFQSGLKPGIKG